MRISNSELCIITPLLNSESYCTTVCTIFHASTTLANIGPTTGKRAMLVTTEA